MRASTLSSSLLACCLLSACGSSESVQWVEGVGFEWDLFNHRLSYAELQVGDDAVDIVVVGGTSTTLSATGAPPDLSAECDPDETESALPCDEFPFNDTAFVEIRTGRGSGSKVASGTGTVDVVADADGETTSIEIELSRKPKGDVIALIHGLTVDTDEPLADGPSCYDPAYGWHPRRIAVVLGEPSVDGMTVTVPVEVAFEAGNSLEDERQCIDAVIEQARVAMTVGVQVISAGGDAVSETVSHGQVFEYSGTAGSPGEQAAPDLSERTIDLAFDGPIGWSAVDFRFHEDDPEDRGAYLRSMSFALDVSSTSASGAATNFSPGTQLSGFDYSFAGTVSAIPGVFEVERRAAIDEVDIDVTDGVFDLQSIDLEAQ